MLFEYYILCSILHLLVICSLLLSVCTCRSCPGGPIGHELWRVWEQDYTNVEEQVLCLLFHILVCFPDPFYATVTADFSFLIFVLSNKCMFPLILVSRSCMHISSTSISLCSTLSQPICHCLHACQHELVTIL